MRTPHQEYHLECLFFSEINAEEISSFTCYFVIMNGVDYSHIQAILIVTDLFRTSRWRPQKVDKRMVLEYTHGLFIT
jgi:hypothetical protein